MDFALTHHLRRALKIWSGTQYEQEYDEGASVRLASIRRSRHVLEVVRRSAPEFVPGDVPADKLAQPARNRRTRRLREAGAGRDAGGFQMNPSSDLNSRASARNEEAMWSNLVTSCCTPLRFRTTKICTTSTTHIQYTTSTKRTDATRVY